MPDTNPLPILLIGGVLYWALSSSPKWKYHGPKMRDRKRKYRKKR